MFRRCSSSANVDGPVIEVHAVRDLTDPPDPRDRQQRAERARARLGHGGDHDRDEQRLEQEAAAVQHAAVVGDRDPHGRESPPPRPARRSGARSGAHAPRSRDVAGAASPTGHPPGATAHACRCRSTTARRVASRLVHERHERDRPGEHAARDDGECAASSPAGAARRPSRSGARPGRTAPRSRATRRAAAATVPGTARSTTNRCR